MLSVQIRIQNVGSKDTPNVIRKICSNLGLTNHPGQGQEWVVAKRASQPANLDDCGNLEGQTTHGTLKMQYVQTCAYERAGELVLCEIQGTTSSNRSAVLSLADAIGNAAKAVVPSARAEVWDT